MAAFDLDQAIVDLVARDEVKVPPYPAVALGIERLLGAGDYGLEDLARLVSSDQVIAADVLRAGNSAYYARGGPVTSVKQAVGRIGAKDVAKLALASGLGSHATAAGPLAPLRRQAWLDALASALLCQALAKGRGLPPDVAFSAGLLHDFGRVIALACIEDLVARHGDLAPRAAEDWAATVDRYHVELGIVMASRWGLPPVLADVLSLHHSDNIAAASDPRIVETVMAMDEVVALIGERPSVTAEELADANLVEPSEHGPIAYAIEALPGFVASFETGDPAQAPGRPSLIAAPPMPEPPPEARGPRPAAHEVVLALGGRKHVCRILGIASTHFMLSGPVSAPENTLMEMSVRCEPPLEGYASVKLAWPEEGAFTMLVQPYALSGDQARRWRELVAQSTAEA